MKQHSVRCVVCGVVVAGCNFVPVARGKSGGDGGDGRLYAVSNSHINKI